MAIYRHENLVIDLSVSSKSKLYLDGLLIFLGDGYKAINIMIGKSKNKEPVQNKFKAQLTMRQKPKFVDKSPEIQENANSRNISGNRTRKK